jgi:hypothetical protein
MAHYPTTLGVEAFQYELLCHKNLELARARRHRGSFGSEVKQLDLAVTNATVIYLRAVAATQAIQSNPELGRRHLIN